MNPQRRYARLSQSKIEVDGRRGSKLSFAFLVLVVLTGLLLLGSCKPSPTPTSEVLTPSASPTPTILDSGFPVADDGAPLPPQVVEQHPAIGQGLSISGEIELIFNLAMDDSSTRSAWRMIGPDGEAIPGTISWPNARTLLFKADQPLQMASDYRVTIGRGAKTARGVALDEPLDFQFTTVGELQVSQTFPLDGTWEVTNDAV
ncbi:MAG: Ig-like domain-containing protein, partial [Anaerolineales bacterium]|nr:Ig-like domain-containing protein [Anaerolineales bacterium]